MRLLYRGAEADLMVGDWCGLEAVFKVRRPLPYRLKLIDDMIREQRTTREAQMIREARACGVRTPYLYFVDTRAALIVMERARGIVLKRAISGLSHSALERVFGEFGQQVARLHAGGIMHGDLTTSNVILLDGTLTFIDFGLAVRSSRLEDHAVDLRLVKETLTGAHSEVASRALDALLDGYGNEAGQERVRTIARQVSRIERRGRYARVE